MKQLIVTGSFPVVSQTFVIREAATLKSEGHEILLLAQNRGDDSGWALAREKGLNEGDVVYSSLKDAPLFCFRMTRFSKKIIRASCRTRYGFRLSEKRKSYFTCLPLTALSRFDLIHAHFVEWGFNVALSLSALLDIPFTVTAHDGHLHQYPAEVLAELQAAADAICLVSNQWKRIWIDKTGSDKKLSVIPNGIEIEEFSCVRRIATTEGVRIVCISRLVPLKRVADLVAALGIIKERGLCFHCDIVGDGPEKHKLIELAERKNVSDLVTFHGFLPHKEVRSLLKSADIFVHPSAKESFGIVIIEAMASYLPVIVAKSAGSEDIVQDQLSGLVYEPGDIDTLSNSLCRLISDNTLRERLGQAGRSVVIDRFSWENHMTQMHNVWQESLQNL